MGGFMVTYFVEPGGVLDRDADEWNSEGNENHHEKCPYGISRVIVPVSMKYDVAYICRRVSTEFFCYLIGRAKDNVAFVTDYYVPEQEATFASSDVKETFKHANIVGTLHKHPGLCNERSGTDDNYFNYNLMVIVTNTGESWNCYAKLKTKCGCFIETKPSFVFSTPPANKKLAKLYIKKIKEKKWGYNSACGEMKGDVITTYPSSPAECVFDKEYNHKDCKIRSYRRCNFVSGACPYKGGNDEVSTLGTEYWQD
jgi:hypothetical protein